MAGILKPFLLSHPVVFNYIYHLGDSQLDVLISRSLIAIENRHQIVYELHSEFLIFLIILFFQFFKQFYEVQFVRHNIHPL